MKPPKLRAGGTWTEARYWSEIRSHWRKFSLRWPPRAMALKAASRPYHGPNKRRSKEYRCAICGLWWAGTEVQVDHIEPCGELRSLDDLPGFVGRLLCEVDGLRCLCRGCHEKRKETVE